MRVLGLPPNARNRLAYLLAEAPLFIEDLQKQFGLPQTEAYKSSLRAWATKIAEVDEEIFRNPAFESRQWRGPNRFCGPSRKSGASASKYASLFLAFGGSPRTSFK